MAIPILVTALLALVGLAILIGSIVVFLKKRRETANSVMAVGVVTGHVREAGRRGWLYYPVVQFETATRQVVSFQSSFGTSWHRQATGQRVDVLYRPEEPQKAEINSTLSLWFVPGCMFVMGLAFLLLGLSMAALFILAALAAGTPPPQP